MNGDDAIDVAFTNENDPNVQVLANRGAGALQRTGVYEGGRGARSLSSADLDGDGDQDLLVASSLTNEAVVLTNGGNARFAPRSVHTSGARPVAVGAADLDADQRPDIVIANSDGGDFNVLMNGDAGFAEAPAYVAGTEPYALQAADFDGDGSLDLAVAKPRERRRQHPVFQLDDAVLAADGTGQARMRLTSAALGEPSLARHPVISPRFRFPPAWSSNRTPSGSSFLVAA